METQSKLRKKSFTIVEQAIHQVRGFRNLYQELDDKVRLSGQSSSTLNNYARKLAQLSLHFGKLPQHISEKEVNKYLAQLARQSKTPSLSDFKFAVYGLRYCYRLMGMNEQFSFTKLHAETGMVAILHSWRQNLSLHPHVHCVVPGGGINFKGQWKQVNTSVNGKVFLFRVENLSTVVRGKFIAALQKKMSQHKPFIRELYKTNWVVYAKEPFAGPEQVIEYLGRYTHKVAISNHRLLNVDETGVCFRWRDYRDNIMKVMTLDGAEFLRRFCQHILPRGFVRIRHYGLLSTARREQLRELQQAFGIDVPKIKENKHWKDICREHLNYNPDSCPICSKGHMVTVEMLFGPRPPPLSPAALFESFVKPS